MNYEHAMLKAAVGFRMKRKDWVNKNVTTSDGNKFTPVLTDPGSEANVKARNDKLAELQAMDENQLRSEAKHDHVALMAGDTKAVMIEKIMAVRVVEPLPYEATDEDKAAEDWSEL